MVLDYIIFIGYYFIICYWLLKNRFFKQQSVGGQLLVLLFSLKVGIGLIHAGLFVGAPDYKNRIDTWRYFFLAIQEKEWLLQNPYDFFADLWRPRYLNDRGVLGTQNSLLNDLKEILVIKWVAISNVLSGNRYPVNLLFFNAITLTGQVVLAIVVSKIFKARLVAVLGAICCWPSILFWSSAVHRDGFIICLIGWIIYAGYRIFAHRQVRVAWVLPLLVCLFLLFLLRNYLVVIMLSGLGLALYVLWIRRFGRIFQFIGVGVLLVIAAMLIQPLVHILFARQQDFMALTGGSKLSVLLSQPTAETFLRQLPLAFVRGVFHPLPSSELSSLEWIAAMESLLWLFGFGWIGWHSARASSKGRRLFFAVFFAYLVFMLAIIAGFTVPFTGALVRYRSIVAIFFVPLLFNCGKSQPLIQILKKYNI